MDNMENATDEMILTPRISSTSNERTRLQLNLEDYHKVGPHPRGRRGNWRETLTDQSTGKTYLVRGASCGLPGCMCDGVIVKEIVAA
jgi:hypothetical protein